MIKLSNIAKQTLISEGSGITDSYLNSIPAILMMTNIERKEHLDYCSIENIKKYLDEIKIWYNSHLKHINLFRDKNIQEVIKDLTRRLKQKNSIHDDDIIDYKKSGYGYGGPSHLMYRKASPDRPYNSDAKTVGSTFAIK